MAQHVATVIWEDDGGFATGRYSRAHRLCFDGGAIVPGSSSPSVVPAFSDPAGVDPEEMLVASVSACHMLWFLDLAQKAGLRVASYRDSAEGILGRTDPGRHAITRIVLRPDIAWSEAPPSPAEIKRLHHEAHERCFIANSLKADIIVEQPASRGNALAPLPLSGGKEAAMDEPERGENLGGTGESSGSPTSASAGQPSGGTLDEEQVGLPALAGAPAAEVATLGSADGVLADAAGAASGATLTGGGGAAPGSAGSGAARG